MDVSALTNPGDMEIENTKQQSKMTAVENKSESQPLKRASGNTENYDLTNGKSSRSTDSTSLNGAETEICSEKDVSKTSKCPSRSTSEYRTLYNHLLEKYKNANEVAKFLEDFALYLKSLAKYQQLRNNMLVDLLCYLNKHESIDRLEPSSHIEIIRRLERLQKYNSDNKLYSNLLKLEKNETDEDGKKNLLSFEEVVGMNDSLSSDLAIAETNRYPDLYLGIFDRYDLVKKNLCYKNNISSFKDLKAHVKADLKHSLPINYEGSGKRRRVATGTTHPSTTKSQNGVHNVEPIVEKNDSK